MPENEFEEYRNIGTLAKLFVQEGRETANGASLNELIKEEA